jgi:glycosyltransferase involved in cell wall biosynthesis
MTFSPLLSVVIPTLDRPKCLDRALAALTRQTLPVNAFEIIVVDNGGAAATQEVVARYQGQLTGLRTVIEQRPGLHACRHRGMEEAAVDLLVYTDDDARGEPGWLEAIVEAMRSPSAVLVTGPCYPFYEVEPPAWAAELWQTIDGGLVNVTYSLCDFGLQLRRISARFALGCNFAIRRDILRAVGGFHPDGMPPSLLRFRGDGETAVGDAINARGLGASYVPAAGVQHLVARQRLTLDYVERRGFLQGVSDSYARVRAAGGRTTATRVRGMVARIRGGWRAHRSGQAMAAWWKGWADGLAWHAAELAADPALLRWVLEPDYFGNRGLVPGHGG